MGLKFNNAGEDTQVLGFELSPRLASTRCTNEVSNVVSYEALTQKLKLKTKAKEPMAMLKPKGVMHLHSMDSQNEFSRITGETKSENVAVISQKRLCSPKNESNVVEMESNLRCYASRL